MATSRRNSATDTKCSTNVVLEKQPFDVHAETLSQLEPPAPSPQPDIPPAALPLKLFALSRLALLALSLSITGFDVAVITHAHNSDTWELPWIFVVRPAPSPSSPASLTGSRGNSSCSPPAGTPPTPPSSCGGWPRARRPRSPARAPPPTGSSPSSCSCTRP
jgi:hypothetical protein